MKIYHGCNCIWLLHTFVNFTYQLLQDVLNMELHPLSVKCCHGEMGKWGGKHNFFHWRVYMEGTSTKLEDVIINLGAVRLRICPESFGKMRLPWWCNLWWQAKQRTGKTSLFSQKNYLSIIFILTHPLMIKLSIELITAFWEKMMLACTWLSVWIVTGHIHGLRHWLNTFC